jgi:phage tail-like protein
MDNAYRYLNRDGKWLDFKLHGVELQPDGSLKLAAVPQLAGDSLDLTKVPEPANPAGMVVDRYGVVYYTVPGDDSLYKSDPCAGGVEPVPCINLSAPSGLAVHSQRNALMICNSGSKQVLVYDLAEWQLLETRGGFTLPVAITVDEAGNSYVVDGGANTVAKYTPAGDPDRRFNANIVAANLMQQPTAVAVQGGRLFVLDTALLDVLVFDESGTPVPGQDVLWEELERPCGLAVTSDSVYVGDNSRRRVLRYTNADPFDFAGEAEGFQGPVAALAIGRNGPLLVNTGQAIAPLVLTAGAGYRRDGFIWSGPISGGPIPVAWHSLHAEFEMAAGAHVQFFAFTAGQPPKVDPAAADPFAGWVHAPADRADFYLGGNPSASLWVGARLRGDSTQSPVLRQMKARFNQKTYLLYLPSIYRDPSPAGDFLPRLLALFESFNAANEDAIERLPELFDPAAIPESYLPWLATWMAIDFDHRWDVAMQRQAIASAYASFAKRGTVAGLRDVVKFETGSSIEIEEPIQSASWWILPPAADPCGPQAAPQPDNSCGSILGVSTRLGQSAAAGAVIGSTAVMDRSRIIAPEDVGMPLFDELAHRFVVRLPAGTGADVAAVVARVLDREKPAHVSYHICSFETGMRVGFQARVGIDTIVADPAPIGHLDETSWDQGVRLGGPPQPRIGVYSRIGAGLRL